MVLRETESAKNIDNFASSELNSHEIYFTLCTLFLSYKGSETEQQILSLDISSLRKNAIISKKLSSKTIQPTEIMMISKWARKEPKCRGFGTGNIYIGATLCNSSEDICSENVSPK